MASICRSETEANEQTDETEILKGADVKLDMVVGLIDTVTEDMTYFKEKVGHITSRFLAI
jgi:hypothetical protein